MTAGQKKTWHKDAKRLHCGAKMCCFGIEMAGLRHSIVNFSHFPGPIFSDNPGLSGSGGGSVSRGLICLYRTLDLWR